MIPINQIIQSEIPVLVDFFADWSMPCKAIPPILQEAKHSSGDELRILKVDIGKNPETAARFHVRKVPTFILFRQGVLLWRQSGMVSATELSRVLRLFSGSG